MRDLFVGGIVCLHHWDGTTRYAVITHTYASLHPAAVLAGHLPPITDHTHCHLDLFEPGGWRAVYNAAPGDQPGQWSWPFLN